MADTAHRLTDEKLEEMEKRLSAIYSRAEKTVQEKMADYAKSIGEKSEELLQATFTADKTLSEMQQAAGTGPIWCVITFAAGTSGDNPVSFGIPPAWYGGTPAFGYVVAVLHNAYGNNNEFYAVRGEQDGTWLIDLEAFAF